MRVAVDTNALYTSRAGVARYVNGLLKGLRDVAGEGDAFLPLAWEVNNLEYRQPARALKTFYRELLWTRYAARSFLRKHNCDILHSPNGFFINPQKSVKNVVTLHDLALLRYPERFRPWQRRSGIARLARLADADKIMADSKFTADEAIQLLGLPMALIEIVHIGCSFSPDSSERKPVTPVDLRSEFFIFVGSLEPGKNLALLKSVYAKTAESGKSLPPLVIVGARWQGVAHEGAPPSGWHFLGGISDEELIYLYRRALALLFPSKYEGFGLPVLEAMALGCPVICSRVASLPEVGGDAVLYAEQNVTGYENSIRRMISDASLRKNLCQRGKKQAENFTWKQCGQRVHEVYREVLGWM